MKTGLGFPGDPGITGFRKPLGYAFHNSLAFKWLNTTRSANIQTFFGRYGHPLGGTRLATCGKL